MVKKNKKMMWIIIAILAAFMLLKVEVPLDGDGTITTSDISYGGGGGGGSGGVPPSGDPDEPCENCDLYYVENKLSNVGPGFAVDEFLTKDGRLVPADDTAPTGHWECRGECPDKNGNKQTCKPRPKLIDPADFNDLPHSKSELGQLMDCYCELAEPCQLNYGNVFCERGIPKNILKGVLVNNNQGEYLDIPYHRIREHCGVAKCEGGCAKSGDTCVMDVDTKSCECKSDTCRKELNIYPSKYRITNNINYNLLDNKIARVRDFVDFGKISKISSFRCVGSCIDGNQECAKSGDDCVCKLPEIVDDESPMPLAQPCSAIDVNGDDDWAKCLKGYCNQIPYCYPVGVDTPGWYLGRTLVKADNNCGGATAYCDAIGTRSEGWYDSSDDSRIMYDKCSDKSPCFYNTYSNKCECTPYTRNCAWKVDWDSFSGDMRDGNYPTRDCEGNCESITNTGQQCNQVSVSAGEICKCEGGEVEEDMDNDGIADNEDNCPTQPGTKLNHGCPVTITPTKITSVLDKFFIR